MAELGQSVKQGQQAIGTAMDPSHEAARTELPGQISLVMEERVGTLEGAAKIQGSDPGCGQHFRVAHLTLRIVPILECFQPTIAKAINEYNFGVHRGSLLVVVRLVSSQR